MTSHNPSEAMTTKSNAVAPLGSVSGTTTTSACDDELPLHSPHATMLHEASTLLHTSALNRVGCRVVLGQYHTSLAALTAQHGTRVPNMGNDEHRRSPSTWWVHEQRHRR